MKHRRGRNVYIHHLYQNTARRKGSLRYRYLALLFSMVAFTHCASNARIVNETESGGTVVYTYFEERDVLSSAGRTDALRLIDEKCPAGYRVSQEGQLAQINRAVDRAWMGQISRDGQPSREKRWAVQFVCK